MGVTLHSLGAFDGVDAGDWAGESVHWRDDSSGASVGVGNIVIPVSFPNDEV